MMNKRNLTLVILITNMFLMSSSNTLVLPFLPIYIKNDLNASTEFLNLFIALSYSATFIVSIFISPLWGHFADKFGKKNMLMRVCLLMALSYFFCYIASTPIQLICARAFQGLACGMTPVIIAFAANLNDEKQQTGLNMGFIQSSNLLGTIIGPCIGGFISEFYSVKICFLAVAIVAVVVSLLNLLCLKDTKTNYIEVQDEQKLTLKQILKDPIMQSLSSCIFVNAAVIMMIVPVLASFVSSLTDSKDAIALSGLIFSLSGIAGAIAAPLWGKIGGSKGFLKVLILSTFFASVLYLFQANTKSIYIFSLIQFLFGLCICATTPAVHSITAKHIDKHSQAKAFSMTYSASQLGNFFGPIICAITVYFKDEKTVFTMCSVLLLLLLSHLVVINIKRNNSH